MGWDNGAVTRWDVASGQPVGANQQGQAGTTLKAAADLYGGVGSSTYNAVAAAWTAINVN